MCAFCVAICLQDDQPAVWLQLLQLCTDSGVCGQQAQEWLAAHQLPGEGRTGQVPEVSIIQVMWHDNAHFMIFIHCSVASTSMVCSFSL
jgi:hypothetical protein